MKQTLRESLRKSVDEQAASYQHRMKMQNENLDNLLNDYLSVETNYPSGKILDVGCGTGILSKKIEKHRGKGKKSTISVLMSPI